MVKLQAGDARRCYERGLQILSAQTKFADEWLALLCHLSLSLADLLIADFDEWDTAERLYREAADRVFFDAEKRQNEQYYAICSIIGRGGLVGLALDGSPFVPHVAARTAEQHQPNLDTLKAELGQKALDVLREEFGRTEGFSLPHIGSFKIQTDDGEWHTGESVKVEFPVPETYYLVAALGDLYVSLGEYEKCMNLVGGDAAFDSTFFEWTYEELDVLLDRYFYFVAHKENVNYAKGLLERPDYREMLQDLKKAEASHRRQEWRQMRTEKKIEDGLPGVANVDATYHELARQMPWVEQLANQGSVANAEALYKQLSRYNWGEVVVGFSNAVEEELKGNVYREYLAFLVAKGLPDYQEASQRQKQRESVLGFISETGKNPVKRQIWTSFVESVFPSDKTFLVDELPRLVDELRRVRAEAAHGKMPDRESAEKARQLVLGSGSQPGLLERLANLRPSRDTR